MAQSPSKSWTYRRAATNKFYLKRANKCSKAQQTTSKKTQRAFVSVIRYIFVPIAGKIRDMGWLATTCVKNIGGNTRVLRKWVGRKPIIARELWCWLALKNSFWFCSLSRRRKTLAWPGSTISMSSSGRNLITLVLLLWSTLKSSAWRRKYIYSPIFAKVKVF